MVRIFEQHSSYIWDMSFSHDDQFLASVAHDNTLVVRNVENGAFACKSACFR